MPDDRIKECTVKFKACVWLNSLSPLCECHLYSVTHLFFTSFVVMVLHSGTGNILVRLQLCECCRYRNNIVTISIRRIIIIIIIIFVIFMQGICNYVLETNHVSGVHSVAAVL
jgi:hypothetical protein